MIAGTLVGAATGVLYWTLAARTADDTTFGHATTSVAVMTLVAVVCGQPLAVTLLRRLPPLLEQAGPVGPVTCRRAGSAHAADGVPPAPALTAHAAVSVAVLVSGLSAAALAAVAAVASSRVAGLAVLGDPAVASCLVLATASQAAGLVADAAAVAARHGRLVVVRSAWQGSGKLLLLVAVALSAGAVAAPGTVLATWAVAGLGSTAFTLHRLRTALHGAGHHAIPRDRRALDGPSLRAAAGLLRAGGGAQLIGVLAASATVQVLPILTSALAGPAAAGVFTLSWLIAGLLFMASTCMCSALLASAASQPQEARARARQAALWHLLVLLPGAGLLVVGAAAILELAGVHDPAAGAPVLTVLALAALPNGVANCLLAWLRVAERLRAVATSAGAGAATAVTTAALLAPLWGPTGTATGWALGQVVTAAVAAAMVAQGGTLSRGGGRGLAGTARPAPAVPAGRPWVSHRSADGQHRSGSRIPEGSQCTSCS